MPDDQCIEALTLRLMAAEHESMGHALERRASAYQGEARKYYARLSAEHRCKARSAEAGAAALEARP